jgi:hypothetical protein
MGQAVTSLVAKNFATRRSASPCCIGGRFLHRRRCARASAVRAPIGRPIVAVSGSCCVDCMACSIAGLVFDGMAMYRLRAGREIGFTTYGGVRMFWRSWQFSGWTQEHFGQLGIPKHLGPVRNQPLYLCGYLGGSCSSSLRGIRHASISWSDRMMPFG